MAEQRVFYENDMWNLDNAIQIAKEAHKNQKDKQGQPYILHPMRVMNMAGAEEEKIVAILHDVVEDNKKWTFEKLLEEGIPDHLIESLKLLTRSKEQDYCEYILTIKNDNIATKVKMADLRDNSNICRTLSTGNFRKNMFRILKYHISYQFLNDQFNANVYVFRYSLLENMFGDNNQ